MCDPYNGRFLEDCGDTLSTTRDPKYRDKYHDKCVSILSQGVILSTVGGYLEYRMEIYGVRGDVFSIMEDMIHVEDPQSPIFFMFSTIGRYH